MQHRAGFYERYSKRLLDVLLSGLALIVLSPLLLVTAVLVRARLGSPVIFCQERPGKDCAIFRLHKFRSMTDARDGDGVLLPDKERLTPFGQKLRALSIDELPELWDIFRGKMSIVGPRPALWNQYDLIAERDKYGANDVTPGLTGWAQVMGRDELEIEDKARYDGEYAQNLSFAFDVRIFFMTIGSVLRHKGVVEGGTCALGVESTLVDLSGDEPKILREGAIPGQEILDFIKTC